MPESGYRIDFEIKDAFNSILKLPSFPTDDLEESFKFIETTGCKALGVMAGIIFVKGGPANLILSPMYGAGVTHICKYVLSFHEPALTLSERKEKELEKMSDLIKTLSEARANTSDADEAHKFSSSSILAEMRYINEKFSL